MLVGLQQGEFAAGQSDTPSGKIEPGERLEAGMAREAFGETGLRLPPEELRLVAVTHWYPPDGTPRVGTFFHIDADPARHGTPPVTEPSKCVRQMWAPLDDLPQPLLRYTEIGIELFRSGRTYWAIDWSDDAPILAGRGEPRTRRRRRRAPPGCGCRPCARRIAARGRVSVRPRERVRSMLPGEQERPAAADVAGVLSQVAVRFGLSSVSSVE